MSRKELAKEIFHAALEASLPKNYVSNFCKLNGSNFTVCDDIYDLDEYENIYIFGSGKAAYTMALEIERLLQSRINSGLIVVPQIIQGLRYIDIIQGSHPIPSQKSFDAATKLLKAMSKCTKNDLYIYLLSGGNSALVELPIEPIGLNDFQDATNIMLKNGLDIHEINCIRKHISKVKGGRLASVTDATGIVLVVSDIVDNDLYSIGSAPLYCDTTTFDDAKKILESHKIFECMPVSIQRVIHDGIVGKIDETPKQEKENIKHYIIASNKLALNAAKTFALSKGLDVKKIDVPMQGDVNAMVKKMWQFISTSKEQCILFGGECTVNVNGDGEGGRNQHLAALMLHEMCKSNVELCFLSAGTDGIDGNSNAAGAVVDSNDCNFLDASELHSFTQKYDSHNFHKKFNNLIITGPTGTNVIDIAIILKGKKNG